MHGAGIAQLLYSHLERRAHEHGARWVRLGVVKGNSRAWRRFWRRRGFVDVRTRSVQVGGRAHTIDVTFKPLAGGGLRECLALVARDRPEAP